MNSSQSAPLQSFLSLCVARAGEPAVFSADGEPICTFSRLSEEARAFQESFLPYRGRVISLALPNHPAWPSLVAGLWLAGATPLLLSPAMPSGEQRRLQTLSGAALHIATGPTLELVWEELSSPSVSLPWPADLLKVTSGTTGAPRLIGFTLDQIVADTSNIYSTMGLLPDDRNFGAIPFSHSYGFSNLITQLLFQGVPLVVVQDSLPRALANAIPLSGATVWPTVPAILNGMVSLGFNTPSALRLVISSGAPLPPETARLFTDLTGLPVHSFYGSSECGGICFDSQGASHEGFVGFPLDGVRLEWAGALEAGVGRVHVHGAAVGQGCFPPSPEDELQNGTFSPPDLLEKTHSGWRLAGRATDWINIGGRKVAPGTIEAALRNMPGIHAAVVFGVPDPGGRGESIVALVEGPSAEGINMLRRRLCQELPAWQIPREWILVDEIPVNERGKINRAELIQAFLEERNSFPSDSSPSPRPE